MVASDTSVRRVSRGEADQRVQGSWRELLEAKIARLEHEPVEDVHSDDKRHAVELLATARTIVRDRHTGLRRLGSWWTGTQCDTAWRVVHEAEAHTIAAMPAAARSLRVQEMLFDAASLLDRQDPILLMQVADEGPTPEQTRELVRRYRAAWDDRYKRSSSYRNRLIQLIALVTVVITLLVILGSAGIYTVDDDLRLRFPKLSFDDFGSRMAVMVAIGTFGSVGGLIAGAGQVVRMGGVYNPMHLPMLALLVKIQMGAVFALAGVLAILGDLLPELRAEGWASLAAYALVFGASQQLLTQVIDRKVNALVSSEPRDHVVKK
jgi:hypothetical protein